MYAVCLMFSAYNPLTSFLKEEAFQLDIKEALQKNRELEDANSQLTRVSITSLSCQRAVELVSQEMDDLKLQVETLKAEKIERSGAVAIGSEEVPTLVCLFDRFQTSTLDKITLGRGF